MTTVAQFAIASTRILDPAGTPAGPLAPFAENVGEVVTLYRAMVLTRAFDAKAVALQRTGRLGTYASSLGQEAVAVGVAAAMRRNDVLVPSFREHGAPLWRGVTLTELFLYWGGDERGGGDSILPRGPIARLLAAAGERLSVGRPRSDLLMGINMSAAI